MYKFQKGEPAILVELFLPHRARYQGALYETLRKGLTLHAEGYASHFNGPHKDEIDYMLAGYGISGDIQDFLARDRRMFFGYSTYEVHGVFSNDHGGEPIEEQTTVIRIIFKPNYKELTAEITKNPQEEHIIEEFLSDLFRVGLRNSYRNSEIIPVINYTALADRYNTMPPAQSQKCADIVRHWIEDVGLFLFGYIVYELSRGVEDNEEEIWVTSHWNFYVNRVMREDYSGDVE